LKRKPGKKVPDRAAVLVFYESRRLARKILIGHEV
jgi:hypothetical protein